MSLLFLSRGDVDITRDTKGPVRPRDKVEKEEGVCPYQAGYSGDEVSPFPDRVLTSRSTTDSVGSESAGPDEEQSDVLCSEGLPLRLPFYCRRAGRVPCPLQEHVLGLLRTVGYPRVVQDHFNLQETGDSLDLSVQRPVPTSVVGDLRGSECSEGRQGVTGP